MHSLENPRLALTSVRAHRWRWGAGLALCAVLAAARSAPAQVPQVVVPPGCGPFSGDVMPPGTAVIQVPCNGQPFFVPPRAANILVLGTACDDEITSNSGAQVTICGFEGEDTLHGQGNVDRISGGADNDSIEGREGNDVLSGGGGDDILFGADFRDTIQAPQGDTLQGGPGSDELVGGQGNDQLEGGGGEDHLLGGGGIDTGDGGADDDVCEPDVENQTSC